MSYSFSIRASNKIYATNQIREQFDAVVAGQPHHAAEKEAVVVAAQEMIRLLGDPAEGQEILISMNGSVGWSNDAPEKLLHANASINTSIVSIVK